MSENLAGSDSKGGRKLRVLVLSQYYFPETGATSNRVLSLAQGFRNAGHDVTVIAEKPNHPEGIIWPEYRGDAVIEGEYDGIRTLYTWVYTKPEKGFLDRILFYKSYMLMAVVAAMRVRGPVDVVVASSPPLFVGLAGWAAARLKRAKFIFDVRDLWPDVAVAMGELNNQKAASLAKRIELFLYRQADAIAAVTRSFCEDIRSQLAGPKRIELITNGTVPETFHRDEPKPALREKLGLHPEEFIVTFAGNLGLAQGLPHIVEAAKTLKATHPNMRILFVGEGPVKASLVERAEDLGLTNITFEKKVPMDVAADFMAASDALLVPLGDHPIYRKFIPSKLFDSMAAGRPVLLSVDGEARSILEEAKAGLYYPAESSEGLADAVGSLLAQPESLAVMGNNGRAFVGERFTRATEARKMVRLAEEIAHT